MPPPFSFLAEIGSLLLHCVKGGSVSSLAAKNDSLLATYAEVSEFRSYAACLCKACVEREDPVASHGFVLVCPVARPWSPEGYASRSAITAKSCLLHLCHLFLFRPSQAYQADDWGRGKETGSATSSIRFYLQKLLPALCRLRGGLDRGLSVYVLYVPVPTSGSCLWPVYS